MTGVPAHMNEAAVHLGTDPTAGVSLDVNFTAAHLAADVPSGRAVKVNLAARHVSSDPMHAGEISLDVESLVAGVTGDSEHLGQRNFAVAVKDHELLDVGERLVAGPIRGESLDLNRDGSFAVVRKPKCHESGFPKFGAATGQSVTRH